MFQAVEASLRRLATDYIDLFWVHAWDQITPVDEVMRGLDDLVRQGKVLHVGISDAPAWWTAQADVLADLRGWTRFVGLQVEYSLIERTVERELVPMANALGLGVLAWSPLKNGVLTGKYHGHSANASGRMGSDLFKEFVPEQARTERIVSAVKSIADRIGRSLAQVALAWLRYRSAPVIPILGARKLSQLEDNLRSLTLEVTPDDVKLLDETSQIDLGFPYELYAKESLRSLIGGGMQDHLIV